MVEVEAKKLVAILLAAFPSNKASSATVQLYIEMLRDLDFDAANQAVLSIIASSRFFPTVAEIRTAAIPSQTERLGMEGWGDVNMAVRLTGRYEAPKFKDQITAECVRQMGWQYLCNSTSEVADRARFCELYDGLRERGVVSERQNLLAAHGSVAGLFTGKPIPDGKS